MWMSFSVERGIREGNFSYRIKKAVLKRTGLEGWMVGFEPTTSRATIWRSNQLNYIHHALVICLCNAQANVPAGIRTPDTRLRRPLLYPTELQAHKRVKGIGPSYLAWKASVLPLNYTRASRGNRTRTCGLLNPNQAL